MSDPYSQLDAQTREALLLPPDQLCEQIGERLEIFKSNDAMIAAMADYMLSDFQSALNKGRDRVLFIVPVGPVGQYDLLAERCVAEGISLDRLTLLIMDEYLGPDGEWIAQDDPLSFRGHMQRHLQDRLPEAYRPQIIIPDPHHPNAVANLIAAHGGVECCFAGVGITGHLAFNDPEPAVEDAETFAKLPTRVVRLSTETRTINSVTASRGNIARIPEMAVTVGMREILSARRLMIFMNRDWQCAAIRRLACGPVTGAFPASLAQRHSNWSLHVVEYVLDQPEPGLR